MNDMTPYKFATHNPLDDEEPILPRRNGREFKGYNIFDVYARALRYIGLGIAAKVAYWSKYKRGGAPIISTTIHKEWAPRYKSVEIDGYHVLQVKANSYRALLNKISETYNLGIKVELL